MGNELASLSAVELARKIREKELSPVEVTEYFLRRIEEHNPKVNAFCTVDAEGARQAARAAEERLMAGGELPPLLGVPVAIKDLTPTKGIRTTYGSRLFAGHVPEADSIVVTRLKEAGAIVLGKTNTPEFGHTGVTDNPVFGRTNNPWDLNRIAGGSSGGSAAAVAAGLVPLAEGSDGGGSIRIPASCCGIYGFKPTYGRVANDTGATAFSTAAPFLHHGPMTRTVEDSALMLEVLQGPDRSDPFSLPRLGNCYPVPALPGKPSELRIAYSPNLDFYVIDPAVRQVMEQAVQTLMVLGCVVEEVRLGLEDGHDLVLNTFAKMWAVHFAAHYGHLLEHEAELSRGLVATIMFGRRFSGVEYKQLDRARAEVYRRVEGVLADYDLLITPTLAVPPFVHDQPPEEIDGQRVNPYNGWMLTSIFNLTGHPVASINAGFSPEGLPVGMQIAGPRFADERVLALSHLFEQATKETGRYPIL